MKTNDFISNVKEKSKPIIVAVFLAFICISILLMTVSIQIFFKMNSLGTFLSAITLLVLFMLVGKVIFNVNYNELFTEIKLSKDDCMNKLLYSIFFSCVYAVICVLIYQIDFTINPDKTLLISNFMKGISNDNTCTNNYDILLSPIAFTIGVLAEEIFFRFTLYKVFVKKREDVIIFIILSSIIFGCYHGYSVSRILETLIIGIFLAIIYVITKSVVYTFISHILWNSITFISSCFMGYFKNLNVSLPVYNCGIATVIMILLLILLSIYSYYKRDYVIPLKVKDKIHSIKNNSDI